MKDYSPIFQRIQTSGEENLISVYHTYWEQYRQGSQYVNALFTYMNMQSRRQKPKDSEFIFADEIPENYQMEIGEVSCFLILITFVCAVSLSW